MLGGCWRFVSWVVGAGIACQAFGQEHWTLDLVPKARLVYESRHQTTVVVTSAGERLTTAAVVRQQKQWEVLDRDAAGTATLLLSIRKLHFEQTEPSGEVLRFDSDDRAHSHPALVEQLSELLEKPLRRVRIRPDGAVRDAEKLSDAVVPLTELPFFVILPAAVLRGDLAWEKDVPVRLEPPLGDGASYPVRLRCRIEALTPETFVVGLATTSSGRPPRLEERIAMLQFQPQGRVTFDRRRRRMLAAELRSAGTVDGFAGPDSSYVFQSTYTERLLEPAAANPDREQIRE